MSQEQTFGPRGSLELTTSIPSEKTELERVHMELESIDRRPGTLFALIIGINKYADATINDLGGAVADADDVYEFLVSHPALRVPKENIKNLRDEEATRANILKELKALGEDPRIQDYDPILIFYAGHGSFTAAPPNWPGGGDIQMLVPHNFSKVGTKDMEGQGILDIQLSHLLAGIAEKKSNNITVIFDCCHSGSGTRDSEGVTFRDIQLPEDYAISPGLMNELNINSRATGVAKGFEEKGLASHILLAACKDSEKAQEEYGRGVFSQALLKLLREENLDRLTYADVIERLPPLRRQGQMEQNPQCEGLNQRRTIFDGRIPGLRREVFEISATGRTGQYTLFAGEARGIIPEAQFAVYADRNLTGEPLGYIKATEVQAFSSICSITPPTQFPFKLQDEKPGYAVQIKAGKVVDVRFLLDLEEKYKGVFERAREEMLVMDAGKRGVEFVQSRDDDPDYVVTAEGDFALFEIMDKTCRENGHTRIPFKGVRIGRDTIFRILRRASDFYFHLRRSSSDQAAKKVASGVTIQCHGIIAGGEVDSNTLLRSQILDPANSNLVVDGSLRLSSSEKKNYGFEIISKHPRIALYAALFYFDMSDLSITPFYLPSTAQRDGATPSIQPNGTLAVGYGSSGQAPRTFFLTDNQDVDVGFLRLFLSTEYVDLSNIEQRSPFILGRATGVRPPRPAAVWSAINVPVIIKSAIQEEDEYESDVESEY